MSTIHRPFMYKATPPCVVMMSYGIGTKEPMAVAKSMVSVVGQLIHVQPGISVLVTSWALRPVPTAIIAARNNNNSVSFFIFITFKFSLFEMAKLEKIIAVR